MVGNSSIERGIGVFIMPIYVDDYKIVQYINEAVEGILQQTDQNWHLIFIEDVSPLQAEALKIIDFYKSTYDEKITVIYNQKNHGPGRSRNLAIEQAWEMRAPFVLFNDQDDISDKDRLALTRIAFKKHPDAVLVYSAFNPIDENGHQIANENLTFSIREIMECYANPPQGEDMWYTMGIESGYINLTSATSALTTIAKQFPFKGMLVSEDLDAWFRYSTEGAFIFVDGIPTQYRLPTNTKGSASRSRTADFYLLKSEVDFNAFSEVLNTLQARQKITSNQVNFLKAKFKLRMINTFLGENRMDLVVKEAIEARSWLEQVEVST